MESTSSSVLVPRISCANVNRERGHVGVEARTNVEVSELVVRGIARVGVEELPGSVGVLASNPILLAYKFLNTEHAKLAVDVKKHNDIPVLVATVETAQVQATVTEEKVLYHMAFAMRNTQSQFMRLQPPEGSEVWSTQVAGKPVKPAMDADGRVMIPLQKSSSSAGGDCDLFLVELVLLSYITESNGGKVKGSGTLRDLCLCPVVDVPINQLYVALYLPENYQYGEFSGDLEETKKFSTSPPSFSSLRRGAHVEMQMQQAPQMQVSNVFIPKQEAYRGRQGVAGVVPVSVTVPKVGKKFFFERLLVREEAFYVSVSYREQTKSWLSKRRLGTGKYFTAGAAGLVAALLYWQFGGGLDGILP